MTKKFSLATYIEGKEGEHIFEIQKTLSELTGSNASIKTWDPHLTIGSGPEVDEEEKEKITEELRHLASKTEPFEVALEDFSYMDDFQGGKNGGYSPYLVYINVHMNDRLKQLAKDVKEITDNYTLWYEQAWPYNPHITVAFKDLWEEGYVKAKEYLNSRTFSERMLVDHISLVENTPQKDIEYCRISFK